MNSIKKSTFYSVVFALVLTGCQTSPPTQQKLISQSTIPETKVGLDQSKLLTVANAQDAINKARKAWVEGKFDLAQTYYIRAYTLAPQNTALLQEMAEAYQKLDKPELMLVCYQLMLGQRPRDTNVREQYGLLLLQQKKLADAERELRQVSTENNRSWQAYNGLGIIADIQARHEEAQRFFNQADRISPDNPEILNNWGYSLYMQEKLKPAKNLFSKALKIQPTFIKAAYNYALVEARQGNYRNALSTFLKVMPQAEAYNDTGYIAMKNGDLTDAEYYLNESQKLSTHYYPKVQENLRELHLRKGDNTVN